MMPEQPAKIACERFWYWSVLQTTRLPHTARKSTPTPEFYDSLGVNVISSAVIFQFPSLSLAQVAKQVPVPASLVQVSLCVLPVTSVTVNLMLVLPIPLRKLSRKAPTSFGVLPVKGPPLSTPPFTVTNVSSAYPEAAASMSFALKLSSNAFIPASTTSFGTASGLGVKVISSLVIFQFPSLSLAQVAKQEPVPASLVQVSLCVLPVTSVTVNLMLVLPIPLRKLSRKAPTSFGVLPVKGPPLSTPPFTVTKVSSAYPM